MTVRRNIKGGKRRRQCWWVRWGMKSAAASLILERLFFCVIVAMQIKCSWYDRQRIRNLLWSLLQKGQSWGCVFRHTISAYCVLYKANGLEPTQRQNHRVNKRKKRSLQLGYIIETNGNPVWFKRRRAEHLLEAQNICSSYHTADCREHLACMHLLYQEHCLIQCQSILISGISIACINPQQ